MKLSDLSIALLTSFQEKIFDCLTPEEAATHSLQAGSHSLFCSLWGKDCPFSKVKKPKEILEPLKWKCITFLLALFLKEMDNTKAFYNLTMCYPRSV